MGICVALVALALLIGAPQAFAVTPKPVSCGGLQSEIDSANAGDVLQLPPGPAPCVTNIVASNTNAFTLEGATTGSPTVLSPADPSTPIIESSADVKFTLTGLTFEGMNGNAAVSLQGPGEAVTISGDTFTANRYPSGFGAAISIQVVGPTTATQPTVITGNTFSGNQASGGAAIAVLSSPVPLTVSGNTFIGNSSSISGGGALDVADVPGGTSAVQITGNTFGGPGAGAGNTTQGEGGAAYLQLAHGRTLTLSSNTFQGNKITGAHTATASVEREGGALFLAPAFGDTAYPVTQSHNAFTGNVIDETQVAPAPKLFAGGAGEWILGLTVSSTGDSFVGNRVAAGDGAPPEGGAVGAFALAAQAPAPALPGAFVGSDDLFSGNSTAAGGWGGAIYVGGPPPNCTGTCLPSSLTLDDATVVGNSIAGTGGEGGAIWGSPNDHLTLNNSIVFGNPPHPELFGFSAATLAIASSDACLETGGPTIPLGVGNVCADPKLGPGGVETAVSPTLDAGSNARVPAGLTTDLGGNPRIVANRPTCAGHGPAIVDMGAYEFTGLGAPPLCPPPLDESNPLVAIRAGPLTDSRGTVAVRLTCPTGQSYCDGTAELDTVQQFAAIDAGKPKPARHSLVLGNGHFHVGGGRSALPKIKLLTKALGKLGKRTSIRVVVKVTDRDAAGRRASSGRTVTLRLPSPSTRGH